MKQEKLDLTYIQENLQTISNYEYIEYTLPDDTSWQKGNDDCYCSIIVKKFNKEDKDALYLLAIMSLSAMIEHYKIKCEYRIPNTLYYNNQLLGKTMIHELDETTYVIDYYLHVNATDTISIKSIAKRFFKVKDPALVISTFFKIYFHFYETQDFKQVIVYANDLLKDNHLDEDLKVNGEIPLSIYQDS